MPAAKPYTNTQPIKRPQAQKSKAKTSRSVRGQDIDLDKDEDEQWVDVEEPITDLSPQAQDVERAPGASSLMPDHPPDQEIMPFCDFCRDFLAGQGLTCSVCGGRMCQITTVGSAGCAMLYRVLAGRTIAPFLCVQCSRKIKEPIMYSHEGYSRMRLYSKSLAPTVVIGLVLSNLKNTSLGWKLTVTTMETEFAWAPNQLCICTMYMHGGGGALPKGKKANKAQQEILDFIEAAGIPCRFLVYIDSHANSLSGCLQVTGGGNRQPGCSPIDKLLNKYIGRPVLTKMRDSNVTNSTLILQTCGPTLQMPESFEKVIGLVADRTFHMVVGFAGASTIPHVVGHTLSRFAASRVIECLAPEEALRNTIVTDISLLKGTPCVFIVPGKSGPPVATQIGHHHPPDRVWGIDLEKCPNKGCLWAPGDSLWTSTPPFNTGRMFCLRCKKNSPTIVLQVDLPSVSRWSEAHPRVYRSVFPLPEKEIEILRNIPERSADELNRLLRPRKNLPKRKRDEADLL